MQLVGKTFMATHPDGTRVVITVNDRIRDRVTGRYVLRFTKNGQTYKTSRGNLLEAIRTERAIAARNWWQGDEWMRGFFLPTAPLSYQDYVMRRQAQRDSLQTPVSHG